VLSFSAQKMARKSSTHEIARRMSAEISTATNISVEFDHPDRVYISGDDLHGNINLSSHYPIKITKLLVILNGETNVEWAEEPILRSLEKFGDYKQHVYAEHDLTQTLEKLIDEDSKLFKGNCTVQFHFKLPDSLPSSVESTFGSTKYVCKVEFIDILHSPQHFEHPHHHDHQHQERPQVLEFPFTVLARIPVGHIPRLERPMVQEELIEISGCFRSEGAILVRLSLPKEEFTLGEVLNSLVYVENQTVKHTVHEIGIALMQDIHFYVQDIHEIEKNEAKVVTQGKIGPIPPGTSEEIRVELNIPKLMPPTQNGKLISIWYRVAIIGDGHITANVSIPIIIAMPDL